MPSRSDSYRYRLPVYPWQAETHFVVIHITPNPHSGKLLRTVTRFVRDSRFRCCSSLPQSVWRKNSNSAGCVFTCTYGRLQIGCTWLFDSAFADSAQINADEYWKRYPNYLRKHFWKEHTFWTDGYFACSVGNVSEEMLRKYIENQGQEGGDNQC